MWASCKCMLGKFGSRVNVENVNLGRRQILGNFSEKLWMVFMQNPVLHHGPFSFIRIVSRFDKVKLARRR